MLISHLHLLLDANKDEGELMAECPSCGVITIDTLTRAWANRFITCECGVSIEIVAEELRKLRMLAVTYQHKIDELIGSN